MFLIFLSFGIMILGKYLRSGITGAIGSFLLMGVGASVIAFSLYASLVLFFLSLFLMYYFIQNGRVGEL